MLTPARRLEALRGLMSGLSAVVIPSTDPHSCEYVSERDKRREFISNFSGSAGTCVVTSTDARLWTDGRYFTQAVQQLDATQWTLMKDRLPETPSVEDWLASVLTSEEAVGVDPSNFPLNALRRLSSSLTAKGIRLCSTPDLVGSVWGGEQPPLASSPLAIHPLQYAGEEWASKVARVCSALEALGADALCINALDEIAWLLNIRGSDVQHCPVALSYALVKKGGEVVLCIDESKLTPEVRHHLSGGKVRLAPYHSIMEELRGLEGKVLVDPASINGSLYKALGEGGKDAAGGGAGAGASSSSPPPTSALPSAPFFNLYLPKSRVIEKPSPIPLLKAIKNAAELEGMKACHLRDGVTLCKFFSWLEGEVKAGKALTEYEAAQVLDGMRRDTQGNKGLSFDTIMGWASNGAVIHYRPEKDTAKTITGSGLLLIDSGGQYMDGTTDVTRVLSFGDVTPHQKRAYTAVLQGHIALSSAKFPSGTGGVALDALARAPIWAQGLDYRHGTGHGVGAYLNVHEGPQGLASQPRTDYAGGLVEHMTITDEPGYYEEGGFGIRIENVLYVKKSALPCSFGGDVWLEFEPFTCVPINTALVAPGQLTAKELAWLNSYNKWVRGALLPSLREREEDRVALAWLLKETEELAF